VTGGAGTDAVAGVDGPDRGAPATGVRAWRIGLGLAGIAAIGYGGWGVLTGGAATAWPVTAVWLLAGVLLHDLVLVPVVAAVGWLVTRLVPADIRPVVRGGLVVAALVTVVALPVVSGRGDADNPSSTPLDYPRNLAFVLVAVAATTAGLAVRRHRRVRPAAEGG
jgi:hypothetical protein